MGFLLLFFRCFGMAVTNFAEFRGVQECDIVGICFYFWIVDQVFKHFGWDIIVSDNVFDPAICEQIFYFAYSDFFILCSK